MRFVLPLNADTRTLVVSATAASWRQMQGDYDVAPVPAQVVAGKKGLLPEPANGMTLIAGRDPGVYSQNADYPATPVVRSFASQWRKWKIVTVDVCLLRYNAFTKTLNVASAIDLRISFASRP